MKLSSTDKFSQNLTWSEDDSNSTHTWIYTYLMSVRFLYALWCGSLLFYLLQRQCEKPVSKIKQIVFPHLFILTAYRREQVGIVMINNMMAFFKFILILIVLICGIYLPKDSSERFASIAIALFISIMILIAG